MRDKHEKVLDVEAVEGTAKTGHVRNLGLNTLCVFYLKEKYSRI